MQDRTKRVELGRLFNDVAKYAATIIVVGGLVSERVDLLNVIIGILMVFGLGIIGFTVIPEDKEKP